MVNGVSQFNPDIFIVVRGFEYASDPESYTSGSVATGRASLAGQVKG
jgi:hypothetical protein